MLIFIQHYLETGTATKSAAAVGYSERSAHTQGSRLLRNPAIQSALEQSRNQAKDANGLSQSWVLRKLKDVAESTASRQADVIAASVAIGKHLNMFTDRKEVDQRITITVERVGG